MCTTLPASSSPYWLLLALLLAASGVAQAQQAPRGGAVVWPKSFGGQPDFEFTKAEALAAKTRDAAAQGNLPPKAPNLADLLDDEVVDPLQALALDAGETSGTLPVAAGPTKLPAMALAKGKLPDVGAAPEVDASGFEQALQYIVRRKVEDFALEQGRYSLGHLMQALVLQAVVTSPMRYAVINGQRYQVGDQFMLPVYAGPSDAELMAALASRLPVSGTLDDAVMVRYRDVYDNFLKNLAMVRASNPHRLHKRFEMPATIVDIQHRKVVIDFNGQRHELAVRYAY